MCGNRALACSQACRFSVQAEAHLSSDALGAQQGHLKARLPGGGRGVSWFLLPPKPDKPLKNRCKQAA